MTDDVEEFIEPATVPDEPDGQDDLVPEEVDPDSGYGPEPMQAGGDPSNA